MTRFRLYTIAAAVSLTLGTPDAGAQPRLNPVIDLLEAHQPVFGLYAPANRRVRPGAAALPADSVKSPAQLAREALTQPASDYVFDGSMEGNFDAGFTAFAPFAKGLADAGFRQSSPNRLKAPMFVKTPEIAPDPKLAGERIAKQLNLGVSGIMFVSVESAAELETGIKAMRFPAQGGTRPTTGLTDAAARWGMSEAEYRERADVWPLNPKGELTNFVVVESREGLKNLREIAAVKGIGVLFPGAGTLRGVFTTTSAAGERVFDEAGWEGAIQQVLAACKEFRIACGYPANSADIEMRMKQGFSVFVMGWGEPGFEAIKIGRKAGGRAHDR